MKFQLREDGRVGFLIVGGCCFTIDTPGPFEIDVKALPPVERARLLYECRRGALACSEPKALIKICEPIVPAFKAYTTPAERPIDTAKVPNLEDEKERIEEDLKDLRALLRETIPSIKKAASEMSASRVRKLLELEEKGKNRKGLKAFLGDLVKRGGDEVAKVVGDVDIGDIFTPVGVRGVGSKQVSDVVESEVKQVVLNPMGE